MQSEWLLGKTGRSLVDIWTLAHLAFWIFIGSAVWPLVKDCGWISRGRIGTLAVCLTAAFIWEIFERFAEKIWPHLWLHPESWQNSYLSDPMTTIIGVVGMMFLLDRFAR